MGYIAMPALGLYRLTDFFALCLRLVVAITDYESGDNPGSTVITVWELFHDILCVIVDMAA
ncbi:hypothetical protein SAMN06264867_112102 [Halorubrum cibi]|uniref:Uncharacterized protein n=1 Tax=Halorubrum cibi TaxID=413815 RepID=A0A521ETA3_9EURY|nr:hypothetical protein SAMN06264867_112102 [Halorubrum cibi]